MNLESKDITNEDALAIKERAKKFYPDDFEDFIRLVEAITDNPNFSYWWGGLQGQHHDFDGGLVKHTREVIDLCFNAKETLNLKEIDDIELFLSALYHDVGKLRDYTPNTQTNGLIVDTKGGVSLPPGFVASPHKRLIHHISRSAIIWSNAVLNTTLYNKYHDVVLHNILSHHGHREWGSPVAPKTQAAWLLHLCDGISARMNDCDRLDLVRGKPH
jgi:23S rRNA maturation-related 3'-5' exoribonuclease YhaM